MNSNLNNLIRLNRSQAEPAITVLSRAFQNDPSAHCYYKNESVRKKITRYFLSFIVYSGIRYGEAYTTSPNLEGVAVWLSSDVYPLTYWKFLRSVPVSVISGFSRYGGYKMRSLGEHVDAVHERLAPFRHWFLQAIGVDPQFQGKGYASQLLKPMLDRIDEEGLPCYLETLYEVNVPLYEHFGFRVIDESRIPRTTLISWAMLRDAR